VTSLDRLLADLLGHKIRLSASSTSSHRLRGAGKRRPIRRVFDKGSRDAFG
jgi:hypothetical protein